MFDNLTYKRKITLLIAVAILLLAVSYKRSIGISVNAIGEIKTLESELAGIEQSSFKIQQRKMHLLQLEEVIGKKQDSLVNFQQSLLDISSSLTDTFAVSIEDFSGTHLAVSNQTEIQTVIMQVKGSYNEIIQFHYALEKEFKLGRITGLSYFKEKNKRTKKEELYATLYIQHFSSI